MSVSASPEGGVSRMLRASGLARLPEMFVDPPAAFRITAGQRSPWVATFLAGLVLAVIGFELSQHAVLRVLQIYLNHQFASNPNMENVPTSFRDQLLRTAPSLLKVDLLMIPLTFTLYVGVQAMALNLVALTMHRRGSFASYWSSICAISVVTYGFNALVQGVSVALRGTNSFAQPSDLFTVLPSAAWAAPTAAPDVLFFLSGINPIWLYGMFLTGLAFAGIARVRLAVALPIALGVGLGVQALAAMFIPATN